MKKKFAIVLAFVLLCAVSTQLSAQKAALSNENNALLFEISGKGLAKPSYIFGTFHVLCPADMLPMEKFSAYIDRAEGIVMELDMDDPAEMGAMSKGVALTGGQTIKDLLTPEQYLKVDEMFKNTVGTSVEPLKMLKPTILSVLVLTNPKVLGCSPSSYELSFIKIAGERRKPIFGLETVAFQSQALDTASLDKQAKWLFEMSKDPQKSAEQFKTIIAVYKEQDVDKLRSAANNQEGADPEFNKQIIDDRNAAWIPKLEAFMKDKPTFIAVGGAHLGGEKGIIKLLRVKGYEVKPIRL